jgi:predicted Zn-dependent protease
MKRRRWLGWGCAHCALAGLAPAAWAEAYVMPPRFTRPDVGSDEGGLWALMDREETRLRRSPFRMREEGLTEYLLALVCKLGPEHCPDIRVYPLRTPFFNASMAPNGMMQVWSGLLLRVENEAQLCAVLAHELAHFLQRHTLERLRDVKARSAFGTFMTMFGIVGLVAALASVAGAFGFSREQEAEADRIGQDLLERAGYDPREAAKIWDNLLAELKANPDTDPSQSSPMFATHPGVADRSRVLAERAADRSGELGAAEYRSRLAPLRFGLLADELKRGRYAESLVLLDRMLAHEPASAELLYYRGEVRRQRAAPGDAELALADLLAAVATASEPALTHRSLGYLQRGLEQPEAARASFQRYLEREPGAADAALIRQYLSEGKPS